MTTVCAGGQRSPAAASKPCTSTAAPAAPVDDDDDEIEVLQEQSLDEVLEVRFFSHGTSTLAFYHCVYTHQSTMVGSGLGRSTFMRTIGSAL